ncbi:nucleoprotein TPR/MLP1 [Artemisia annua]|uniref:Nucleoprotein TPR/MLP1 n=1 Tax=Artemisia annua TaxID=35608 RepID=A0A2U1L9L4_ARTAN|nr:nucleoprotein TPR/MLP1 [Artemisia annua]
MDTLVLTFVSSSSAIDYNQQNKELTLSSVSEKALVERVNDELILKANNLIELKKVHGEQEADLSSKVRKLKEKYKDTSSLLKKRDDKLRKLESKLEALHNKLCSCKEMAAANEERLSDELSTIHKIVEVSEEVIECLLKGDELLAVSAKLTRSHANAVTYLTKQLKKVESTNNELDMYFHDSTIDPKLCRLANVSYDVMFCLYDIDVMQAFCETSVLPPASEANASTFAWYHILADGGSNLTPRKGSKANRFHMFRVC